MPSLVVTSVRRVAIAGTCLAALGAAFVLGFYVGEAHGYNVGIALGTPAPGKRTPLPVQPPPVPP
jgi:hypothetical protein